MKFLVQKLREPRRAVNGSMLRSWVLLEKRTSVPDDGWREYIRRKYKRGRFKVFTSLGGRPPKGGFKVVFLEEIR